MTRNLILPLCLMLLLWQMLPTSLVHAVVLTPDKIANIEGMVTERLASQGIPGASVALVEQGQIRYAKGFGTADLEGTPMTAQTPSSLGSISKSFTAVVVLQLAQEGLLDLDQPASAHLPELRQVTDERVSQVTVRQLLSHTSGYSTYVGNFGQADFSQTADALVQATSLVAAQALAFAPGEKFQYSNANYQILGLLIERLTKTSFEQAVQQRILLPLGMHNSFVLNPRPGQSRGARPHRFWLHRAVPFGQPPGRRVVAQGGVVASAEDLATYLLDLHSASPVMLSPASRDAMLQPQTDGAGSAYALGLFVEEHADGPHIFHGGSNPGFETEFGYLVDAGVGYVVLVNAGSGMAFGNVQGLTDAVKNGVLGRAIPQADASSQSRTQLLLTALVTLALMLGSAVSLIRLVRRWKQPPDRSTNSLVKLASCLALLVLAWLLWFELPRQFGIPLAGLRAFAPDVGWLLTLSGLFAVVWGLCHLRVWVRLQRPPGASLPNP